MISLYSLIWISYVSFPNSSFDIQFLRVWYIRNIGLLSKVYVANIISIPIVFWFWLWCFGHSNFLLFWSQIYQSCFYCLWILSNSKKAFPHIKIKEEFIHFLLVVVWFYFLHLYSEYIWSLFFYLLWDMNLILSFSKWLPSCFSIIH